MMPLKEELKALIIRSGWSMTEVVNKINEKYKRDNTVQNFSSKLIRGTLKYSEVEEVLELLEYKIEWVKKEMI